MLIVREEEGESKTRENHVGIKRDVPSPRHDDTAVPNEPPGQLLASSLLQIALSLFHHTQIGFIAIGMLSHHAFEPIGILGSMYSFKKKLQNPSKRRSQLRDPSKASYCSSKSICSFI